MTFTASKPKMHEHSNGVAWTSNLKWNGKTVAMVENDGRGACDSYVWMDGTIAPEFLTQAQKFNATLSEPCPFAQFDHRGLPSPDFCARFFESLMSAAEKQADFIKDCKKHVLVQLPGEEGTKMVRNQRPTPEFVARLRSQYPGIKILNPGIEA